MKVPSLKAILCGCVPFVGTCFSVTFWDRIYPLVFGIPFNFFWLTLWLLLGPLCMWGAYHLETSRSPEPPGAEHGGEK